MNAVPLHILAGLTLTARLLYGETDWPTRETGVVFSCPAPNDQIVPELERIKRDGFNQIKFASWPWTVPEPGTAIYSNAVTTLNWCENNGVDFWLLHNLQYHAASAEKTLTNSTGLDAEDETLRPWMQILTNYRCVKGILAGNEVNTLDKSAFTNSPALARAFIAYLSTFHGTVSTLNARWRTDYRDFADITVTHLPQAAGIDMKRFFGRDIARYYDTIFDTIVKPYLDDPNARCPRLLFGSKLCGDGSSPFVERTFNRFTVCSWDDLTAHDPLYFIKVLVDTVQAVKKRPVYNSELHLYHDSYGFSPTVEFVRFRYLYGALLGEWKNSSFVWGEWGKCGPFHEAAINAIDELKRLEPQVRALQEVPAEIGFLITEQSSRWNIDMAPADMQGEIAAFAWLSSTGRPWRYVLKDDVADSPAYLVMETPRITAQTHEALLALPSHRVVVIVGAVPMEDEWGNPLDKDKVRQLTSRCIRVGTWPEIVTVLPVDVELSQGADRVCDLAVPSWSPERGSFAYHIPSPRLEVRKADCKGKMLVALINHTPREITVSLPWLKDQGALELTGTGKENMPGGASLTLRAYDFRLLQSMRSGAQGGETH